MGEPSVDRQCRICLDGSDGEELGPLFRPCSCRGTMAWVHMECLDKWRRSSVNPRSFYRCDNCHFEYRFGRVFEAHGAPDRFTLARLLGARFAVHTLSVLTLLTLVFVGGFASKLATPGLTWWDVISCFNLHHMMSGSIVTGLGSLVGWMVSLTGGVGPRFFGDTLGLGGIQNRTDAKAGKVLLAIAVVAGLCIALSWIYGRIEEYAERTTRHAQRVVLDAHHLHREHSHGE